MNVLMQLKLRAKSVVLDDQILKAVPFKVVLIWWQVQILLHFFDFALCRNVLFV
jgi:hypothetical protein